MDLNEPSFEPLGLSTNQMMAKFKKMHNMTDESKPGPSARVSPRRLHRDIQRHMVKKTNTGGLRSRSLMSGFSDRHSVEEVDQEADERSFDLKGSRPMLQLK